MLPACPYEIACRRAGIRLSYRDVATTVIRSCSLKYFFRFCFAKSPLILVGALGFEPRTSCSQSKRASQLRYAP